MQTIMLTEKGSRKHLLTKNASFKAVQVVADYPGEMFTLGHQIVEGPNAGLVLTVGDYVLSESIPTKRELSTQERNSLVSEVTTLISQWDDKPYATSKHDDRMAFACDLVQFFQTKFLNG